LREQLIEFLEVRAHRKSPAHPSEPARPQNPPPGGITFVAKTAITEKQPY